jgi:hypothetical protein
MNYFLHHRAGDTFLIDQFDLIGAVQLVLCLECFAIEFA